MVLALVISLIVILVLFLLTWFNISTRADAAQYSTTCSHIDGDRARLRELEAWREYVVEPWLKHPLDHEVTVECTTDGELKVHHGKPLAFAECCTSSFLRQPSLSDALPKDPFPKYYTLPLGVLLSRLLDTVDIDFIEQVPEVKADFTLHPVEPEPEITLAPDPRRMDPLAFLNAIIGGLR